MWLWALACTGPTAGEGPPVPTQAVFDALSPSVLSGPTLSATDDTPLSRRLTLEVDRPCRLSVELRSDEGAVEVVFADRATAFDVPILGLHPATQTEITARLVDDDGVGKVVPVGLLWTEPLPDSFPTIDVLAADPARAEPGYWLVSMGVPDGAAWLAVLDAYDLSVVWVYTGAIDWGDVRDTPDGTLIGLAGGAWEMDLTGRILTHYTPSVSPQTESSVSIPWLNLHHELYPLDDGTMVSLTTGVVVAPQYPLSYDDPTPVGPAAILDDHVVRFDRDGVALGEVALSSVLDTARIGFGSLTPVFGGYDWSHANAVVPYGDELVVSVRHQDALVALDADGQLAWILGDPAGWPAAFAPYLLSPTPGTTWMYHQHGHNIDADGRIVLFDNRMVSHTPYSPDPLEVLASRIVAYAVDEDARTVDQLWAWSPPDGPLLSNALGNAQWLPTTGHVLADFGFLDGEAGVLNETVGRGRKHVRLMEIDPDEVQPIVDVRMWIDAELEPEGVKAYRVDAMPSLYGPLATVRRLDR